MDMDRLQRALQSDDQASANRVCDEALDRANSEVFALYWKGQLCKMSADPAGAVDWLEQSFAAATEGGEPESIGIVGLAFGIALQHVDRWQNAADVFRLCADKSPEVEPSLRNSLGISLRRLGDDNRALEAYNHGLTVELRQVVLLVREKGCWGLTSEGGNDSLWWDERFPSSVHAMLEERGRMPIMLANAASILLDRGETERAADALFRSVSLGDPNGTAARLLAQIGRVMDKTAHEAAIGRNMEQFVLAATQAALTTNA